MEQLVHRRRTLPGYKCVSDQFPQLVTILAFHQRIFVAMSGSGFGDFNVQFFQLFSHPIIHIFTAVVAVKPAISNGNMSNNCCSVGIRYSSEILSTETTASNCVN